MVIRCAGVACSPPAPFGSSFLCERQPSTKDQNFPARRVPSAGRGDERCAPPPEVSPLRLCADAQSLARALLAHLSVADIASVARCEEQGSAESRFSETLRLSIQKTPRVPI